MKDLGAVRLALVYAGCFLGAGYVSGQELWQFFGVYGKYGYAGLLLAMALLGFFGVLMLLTARKMGDDDMDHVVIPWQIPWLHSALGVLECVFFFGVIAIMNAGVGAMAEQLFLIPHALTSAVFCALVLLIALLGLRGLASAFSVSVPLLVICTVLFGIIAVKENGFVLAAAPVIAESKSLLGCWLVGAVVYASYNIFGAFGIVIPFAGHVRGKRTVYAGIGLGTVLLALIAMSVLLSLHALPAAAEAELPMLYCAERQGSSLAYGYAFLLLLAMFGTSLSCLVGMVEYLELKRPRLKTRHGVFVAVLLFLAYLAGLFGFGDLIGVIYPVFGYAGAAFLLCLLVQGIRQRKASAGSKKAPVGSKND